MVHHGFRSKEARRAGNKKHRLRQTTSHSSLLVAGHDDVSRKLNQAFLLVDSFNFNFVDEEGSDIYPLQAMLKRHKVNQDKMSCEPINGQRKRYSQSHLIK